MVLEDDGGALALGSGIELWFKIAAAALSGRGSRRTCNIGVGVDVGVNIVKAKGLLLWCWHQRC